MVCHEAGDEGDDHPDGHRRVRRGAVEVVRGIGDEEDEEGAGDGGDDHPRQRSGGDGDGDRDASRQGARHAEVRNRVDQREGDEHGDDRRDSYDRGQPRTLAEVAHPAQGLEKSGVVVGRRPGWVSTLLASHADIVPPAHRQN